ncbi:MAG: hypothetical protein LBF22_12150 [Deltaproteobacteria bacterium]|nr:hypothetical protein [Deltaproteobacteria bacterium]
MSSEGFKDFGSPPLKSQNDTIETFVGLDFNNPKASEKMDQVPRTMEFVEFENHNKPLSKIMEELPSLNYLFTPFDPGKIENKPFAPTLEVLPQEFPFEDLDPRDSNIINTLDRALKKEKKIIEAANLRASEIIEESRVQAMSVKDGLIAAAQEEAAKIKLDAEKNAGVILLNAEVEKEKLATLEQQTAALKEETAQILSEVSSGKEQNIQRATELEKLKADLLKEKEAFSLEKDKIIQDAKNQATEEGKAIGLAEGFAFGEKKGLDSATSRLKNLFVIMDRLSNLYFDLWSQNAPQMVDLAVEAASAIVDKEITDGKGLAAGAFNATINYLKKAHEATFRVRPEDLHELEEARIRLKDEIDGLTTITLVPDPSLGPGDLIMESDAGRLDATLKTRRENVISALKNAIAQGAVGNLPGPPSWEKQTPNAVVSTSGSAPGSAKALPESTAPNSPTPETPETPTPKPGA